MIKYNHDVSQIGISLMVAVYVNLNKVHIFMIVIAKSWRVLLSDCKRNENTALLASVDLLKKNETSTVKCTSSQLPLSGAH